MKENGIGTYGFDGMEMTERENKKYANRTTEMGGKKAQGKTKLRLFNTVLIASKASQ